MNIEIHPVYDKNNRKDANGSYTNLSDEEVMQLVRDNWDKRLEGDTEDCSYVPVDPADWFCPETQLQEGDLVIGRWGKRDGVKNDTPVFHTYALVDDNYEKQPANDCHLVVYETGEKDGEMGYALVTVLATLGTGVPPMDIQTAQRNVFVKELKAVGLDGGSKVKKLKTDTDRLDYLFQSFIFYVASGVSQPAPKDLVDRVREALK